MSQNTSAAQGAHRGQLRLHDIPTQLPVAGELAAAMHVRHPEVEVFIASRTSRAIDLALEHYECDLVFPDLAKTIGLVSVSRDPELPLIAAYIALAKD